MAGRWHQKQSRWLFYLFRLVYDVNYKQQPKTLNTSDLFLGLMTHPITEEGLACIPPTKSFAILGGSGALRTKIVDGQVY